MSDPTWHDMLQSIDQILPNLYLTNFRSAEVIVNPPPDFTGPKIQYVLTLRSQPLKPPRRLQGPDPETRAIFLKHIKINDVENADLLAHLEEICDFISSSLAKNDGGVLVHCKAGVSRSASAIIAYMMKEQKINFTEAFLAVSKARQFINPNLGFQKQLRLWGSIGHSIREEDGELKQAVRGWYNEKERLEVERRENYWRREVEKGKAADLSAWASDEEWLTELTVADPSLQLEFEISDPPVCGDSKG